jgi:hypothetical protein
MGGRVARRIHREKLPAVFALRTEIDSKQAKQAKRAKQGKQAKLAEPRFSRLSSPCKLPMGRLILRVCQLQAFSRMKKTGHGPVKRK